MMSLLGYRATTPKSGLSNGTANTATTDLTRYDQAVMSSVW